MIANDTATRALIQNGTNLKRSRASLIALWLTQVALSSPAAPLVLLVAAAALAWTRRNQLQGLFSR
jgi:hypothetical protein